MLPVPQDSASWFESPNRGRQGTATADHSAFKDLLYASFTAINNMMILEEKTLVGTKDLLLQRYAFVFRELSAVLSLGELAQIASE